MRVRKHDPSDLADTLKQLKITDRRSRPPAKGRISRSAIFLAGGCAVDYSLRTRSISSTTGRIGGFCGSCLTCECRVSTCKSRAEVLNDRLYRQNLQESLHLDLCASPYSHLDKFCIETESGFSPFSPSAGLLYSTLPTNFLFPVSEVFCGTCGRHVAQSSDLRRSCGTELGQLHRDSINPTTSTTCSNLASVAPTIDDRRRCFSTYSSVSSMLPSNQVRLSRRLCSLLDHPCVGLYHSSRSIASVHFAYGRLAACRNRHTVTPSSPYCSDADPKLQLNYDLTIPLDCTPLSQRAPSLDEAHEGYSVSEPAKYSPPKIGVSETKTLCSEANDSDNDQYGHRCRRKSDPEYWQQIRANEIEESDAASKINRLSSSAIHSIGVSQSFFAPTGLAITSASQQLVDQTIGDSPGECFKCYPFVGYHSSIPLWERTAGGTTFSSNTGSSLQAANCVSSTSYCITEQSQQCSSSNRTLTRLSSQYSRPTNLAFSFRTSILSSHGSTSTLSSSDGVIPLNALEEKQRSLSGSQADISCTPTNDVCTGVPLNMVDPSTLNLDSSLMACLQSELSPVEHSVSPCSSAPGCHLSSDISVNELASYMEHMVHIPGRMSEMAQRMYL